MPKILQINTTCNVASTGHIAESIGCMAQKEGWEVWIAHGGRYVRSSKLHTIAIQSRWADRLHIIWSMLTGRHGQCSYWATKRFIRRIQALQPDLIHLHNIHGYYLHYPLLFQYLQQANIPIIWTLHDCWAFTGHCAAFNTETGCCNRWQTGCYNCPKRKEYPAMIIDRSSIDYVLKKSLFTAQKQLTLVPVSQWLADTIQSSYLQKYPIKVIRNGINLSIFHPYPNREQLRTKWHIANDAYVVLGVASPWVARKGYADMLSLTELNNVQIVMIGLSPHQCQHLPSSIIGIPRTESTTELAEWYSLADVFVNPTYADTYPTTQLEALACGTPVITYLTDGAPESITPQTGLVVERGNMEALKQAIVQMQTHPLSSTDCRKWAEEHCNEKDCFEQYIHLYKSLL